VLFWPAVLAWIVGVVIYAYFINIASNLFRGALYIYASEGVVPKPYSEELLDTAWEIKKAK